MGRLSVTSARGFSSSNRLGAPASSTYLSPTHQVRSRVSIQHFDTWHEGDAVVSNLQRTQCEEREHEGMKAMLLSVACSAHSVYQVRAPALHSSTNFTTRTEPSCHTMRKARRRKKSFFSRSEARRLQAPPHSHPLPLMPPPPVPRSTALHTAAKFQQPPSPMLCATSATKPANAHLACPRAAAAAVGVGVDAGRRRLWPINAPASLNVLSPNQIPFLPPSAFYPAYSPL